jgi:hypothetical protein
MPGQYCKFLHSLKRLSTVANVEGVLKSGTNSNEVQELNIEPIFVQLEKLYCGIVFRVRQLENIEFIVVTFAVLIVGAFKIAVLLNVPSKEVNDAPASSGWICFNFLQFQ